ncbi:MAG TPA: TIGR03435 family protein, partial [Bryobacteraceae bacterium]
MMLRGMVAASLAVFVSVGMLGQTAPRPVFEVASVKPSGPPSPGPQINMLQGGPGTADPERIRGSRVTLQPLLREAYAVDFDQIQAPDWLADERYDIVANVPPGTTKAQLKLMLQDLLAERFKLALHIVKKDFAVYELTIAKGGFKLNESTNTLEQSRPGGPRMPLDANGFPQIPSGTSGMASAVSNGLTHMTARGVPFSLLTGQLGAQLGTITGANTYAMGRIVDKTGLTGKYDFNLEYA